MVSWETGGAKNTRLGRCVWAWLGVRGEDGDGVVVGMVAEGKHVVVVGEPLDAALGLDEAEQQRVYHVVAGLEAGTQQRLHLVGGGR